MNVKTHILTCLLFLFTELDCNPDCIYNSSNYVAIWQDKVHICVK